LPNRRAVSMAISRVSSLVAMPRITSTSCIMGTGS
jgi:hypothetical protein